MWYGICSLLKVERWLIFGNVCVILVACRVDLLAIMPHFIFLLSVEIDYRFVKIRFKLFSVEFWLSHWQASTPLNFYTDNNLYWGRQRSQKLAIFASLQQNYDIWIKDTYMYINFDVGYFAEIACSWSKPDVVAFAVQLHTHHYGK